MAGTFTNQRTSFASGEVNPSIRAANDLARFQTGAELVENLVVMIEAILTRCPGTRMVLELKDETQRGKMVPFRYSGSDFYMLAFNGGAMRVLKDQGFLESAPGTLFELGVPWVEADMVNLRSAGAGNNVIQVASGKRPQKITRNGHTNWTIAQYRPQNGPVETQNLNTAITILASAVTGNGITLIGAGNPFQSGWVDGVIRLDEPSQSIVPLWQANESITLSTQALPGASNNLGDVTNHANAFDASNATSATKAAATTAWVGRTYLSPTAILTAVVLMSSPAPTAHGSITLQMWAKNGAQPNNETDGTLLAQTGYDVDTDGSNPHTLTSNDTVTTWAHIWWRAIYSGGAVTIGFAEITTARLTAGAPVLRRWQSNVYQALTGGNTGVNAPVHTDGDVAAGTGNVTWRYLHSGYGFVQITGVTNGNQATGNVLSRIPESVIATPTYRWYSPSWCDAAGWPDQVATFDQRMHFQRGNTYWSTKPLTVDDFEVTTFEDSAIARRLVPPEGNYEELEWAVSAGNLIVQGSRDHEWITRAPGDNAALTVLNVVDIPDDGEGSAPHIPAFVEKGCIFIGKSRGRLHYCKFTRLAQELDIQEISVASRHMFKVGAVAMAWQRDPHRLLWIVLADGSLVCATFMPDEKIIAFTRCPKLNCFIEDIESLPTSDSGRSDVYLQTRRTINGQTRRFYELLMPFFEPLDPQNPTAEGAWFVDCGLRYQGPAVSRVTGADHLIGQEVAILANGTQHPRKVVDAQGGVDLNGNYTDVILGIPTSWRMRDLPRDITVQGQTTHSSPKHASHIVVDVKDSAGGAGSFNGSTPNDLTETGAADYGAPIKLFTGQARLSLASETKDEGVLELVGNDVMPFTLLATTPTLEIDEAT